MMNSMATVESALTVGNLLQSNLELQNRLFAVTLTPNSIYWDVPFMNSPYTNGSSATDPVLKIEEHTIDLRDVLYVVAEPKSSVIKPLASESAALQSNIFTLSILKRIKKYKWRDRKMSFTCRDAVTCQLWMKKIKERLRSREFRRPKCLLVFINPYSGKKDGPEIYSEKIAPLFKLADIHTEVVETVRANHARDMIMEYNLSKIDGVVCVGGDGMFSEVMHGLLFRTRLDAGFTENGPKSSQIQPFIRIGIISAGSTDTVAYTTMGINDPVTGALHIILGDQTAIDAFTVHHGNQFLKYGVSLMGYGYYGDIVLESDEYRWMGPKRYDFLGLKKFFENKSYSGEIAFLPCTNLENHPRDGTRCMNNCNSCHEASQQKFEKELEKENTKFGKDGWQRICGNFLAINSFTMSCRCALSPEGASPSCHLGDGTTDLVIVHECSRFDYLRHLIRTSKKMSDQFDFNFVQVVRVKEYKFRPKAVDEEASCNEMNNEGIQRLHSCQHNSIWNCDGEVITQPSVDVKVHCQLVPLFARGLEEEVEYSCSLNCGCLKAKKVGFVRDYGI